MDAILINRIETGTERVASTMLGAAVAFALYKWLGADVLPQMAAAYSAAAGVAAFFLSNTALKTAASDNKRVAVPVFDLREVEWPEEREELVLTDSDRLDGGEELVLTDADRLHAGDELLLTDSDRLQPAGSSAMEPLLLDDVVLELGSEARVVRLFDPASMPTPEQLKSRIDEHLGQGSAAAVPSDASQALSDALAELKRSLR